MFSENTTSNINMRNFKLLTCIVVLLFVNWKRDYSFTNYSVDQFYIKNLLKSIERITAVMLDCPFVMTEFRNTGDFLIHRSDFKITV